MREEISLHSVVCFYDVCKVNLIVTSPTTMGVLRRDRRGNAMLILCKGYLLIRHHVNIRSDSFITPLRSFITETHINMTTDCGNALIGDTHLSAHRRHDGNPMSNGSSDRGFVIQSDHITTITRRYIPCHVISRTLNFRTHEGRNTVTLLI